jgi:hypothetical protein
MPRSEEPRAVGTTDTKPYDELRRARPGELRHRDVGGLRSLHDEYYALADEFETLGGEEPAEFTHCSQSLPDSDEPEVYESVTRIVKATRAA